MEENRISAITKEKTDVLTEAYKDTLGILLVLSFAIVGRTTKFKKILSRAVGEVARVGKAQFQKL